MTQAGQSPTHRWEGFIFWNRSDRRAMTVLLGIWGIYLTFHAAGHTIRPGWPIKTDPMKVELVREKIDPNTASAASLKRLPMVGPAKAEAIVAYRQSPHRQSGLTFESPEDLKNVPGIGPGIVERIKDHMSFSEARP